MTRRAPDNLKRDPTWLDDAACLNHLPVFFPRRDNAADEATAKRICAACPVKSACLAAAMAEEGQTDHLHRAGLRGGITPQERAAYARTWRRRKATA
jgi:hypothetical protein